MASSHKLILEAMEGRASRVPVWLMRQAGRHLPEYLALKQKYSFLELCKTTEAAVEASLQPIRRYNMDGVICFSDILVPLEAMGLELDFNPGPVFAHPLRSFKDLDRIQDIDVKARVPHILEILSTLKAHPETQGKTILGFTGAPYTLASYAIEGKTSKDFEHVKAWMYRDKSGFLKLMDRLADLVIAYILEQKKAGADAVQLFDTWAGHLSREDYRDFVCPSTEKIIAVAKENQLPLILYCNGGSHLMPEMLSLKPDCLSLDWRMSLKDYCLKIPDSIAIQGNLDPSCLYGSKELVIQRTRELLDFGKKRGRYILNLGHGLLPNTPIENVKAFVDCALQS